VIVGLEQHFLDSGVKLSVVWQVLPYFVITVAEILISITGLEFAYTQAPRAMKSTIMSFWLLTVFLGNMITAYIARMNKFPEGSPQFFYFFAFLMTLVGIGFCVVAAFYKTRNFMEDQAQLNKEQLATVNTGLYNMDEHSELPIRPQ
jgi:POT family proton-dependent oligopeptide transporter